MAMTAPMAYAAPFETGTGLAPAGKLILFLPPVLSQMLLVHRMPAEPVQHASE